MHRFLHTIRGAASAAATNAREADGTPSWGGLVRFFLPLVLASLVMFLSYPLVAGIVSHGRLGVDELSAFGMGQQVMFLVGAVGAGLVQTGLVFATTREGAAAYRRMNLAIAAIACGLVAAACLPGPARLVFGRAYGLPPELARVARLSLLCCLPLQANFFARNLFYATLLRVRRSDLLNLASFVRIATAAVFAVVFVRVDWTGWAWGVVASTLPCFVETGLMCAFARPHLRALRPAAPDAPAAPVREQLAFTIPLSLGGILMVASGFLVLAFLNRSGGADAVLSLVYVSVHLLVFGVANPLAMSGMQMQNVVLAFRPTSWERGGRRIFGFAVAAGLCLAASLLVFGSFGRLARWYFCGYQTLAPENLALARRLLRATAALPLLYCLSGRANGLAALERRSRAILCGQAAYCLAMAAVLWLCLAARPIPGYFWGLAGIGAGVLASWGSVHGVLARSRARRRPRPAE